MTYAELEALEKVAGAATAYEAEVSDTPLPRKFVNGITGLLVLLAGAVIVLCVVVWRAH